MGFGAGAEGRGGRTVLPPGEKKVNKRVSLSPRGGVSVEEQGQGSLGGVTGMNEEEVSRLAATGMSTVKSRSDPGATGRVRYLSMGFLPWMPRICLKKINFTKKLTF